MLSKRKELMMPFALHTYRQCRRVQSRLVNSFWKGITKNPSISAVVVFMVTVGLTWPPHVLNECQALIEVADKSRRKLKLHISFSFCAHYNILEECKILIPKNALIKLASAAISNDSCSSVMRNCDLKCGNNFCDTQLFSCAPATQFLSSLHKFICVEHVNLT